LAVVVVDREVIYHLAMVVTTTHQVALSLVHKHFMMGVQAVLVQQL
jgi:hypothetical protein